MLRISHLIYPLTARVVGVPQMISQPVSSIFPCFLLPSGTWRTPGLSIPCCCLPTSSSVCLVFFPLSLCLARWFWPDLMNGSLPFIRSAAHTTNQLTSPSYKTGAIQKSLSLTENIEEFSGKGSWEWTSRQEKKEIWQKEWRDKAEELERR